MKVKPLLQILGERFTQYSEKELYSFIMCGEVKVEGETVRDPARKISSDKAIKFLTKKWVSRGGEKLYHAIMKWNIDCRGKTVLDAGSSTGGFTDVLLHHGASMVYAVDVGYNQLDYRLRVDKRVRVMERTNIMAVKELEPAANFAVADLSFRSIGGAASHILNLTTENRLIALIKPQFELTETEKFDGVIRDKDVLFRVLLNTAGILQAENVFIEAVLESPIKGGKGNTEFLFMLEKRTSDECSSNAERVENFLKRI